MGGDTHPRGSALVLERELALDPPRTPMTQFDLADRLSPEPPGIPMTDAQMETLAELIAARLASHLIDAAEASGLLGVPATWVLAEARANRVPHVRLGKYVRFEPDALTAWWTSRQHAL